jgi:hypothetical protein
MNSLEENVMAESDVTGQLKTSQPGLHEPATSRCLVHIRFLDPGKGLFNFFLRQGQRRLAPMPRLSSLWSPATKNSETKPSKEALCVLVTGLLKPCKLVC